MKIWIFVFFAVMNFAIPGLSYSETAHGGGEDGGTVGPSTLRISLDSSGGQFSHDTTRSEISANGRYVAFIAKAAISSPVVFRHDLLTGAVEEVSIDSEGSRIPISESLLAISADGRYVVFHMRSTGIYIRDMSAGVNEFIDIPTTDGEPPTPNRMGHYSITPDARIIAFASRATNLVPGECSTEYELGFCAYVFDRDVNIVERVSVAYDGTPQNFASHGPKISADGRYVAFYSSATNLVPDDVNEMSDIFVHDRDTGITERVSVASDGTGSNGLILAHSMSADGRYIAFGSTATDLVPDDTNDGADVFVRDRVAGTTERVSVNSDGTQGNGPSSMLPAIGADGRFVAFDSWASNLVPDDTNDTSDHFLHDRLTGETERISVTTDGTEGNSPSFSGIIGISADNRFVAFPSHAALVPSDANGKGDIYVRDRGGEPPDGPVPAFVPSSVSFGAVEVGTTSTPQNATLTNFGGGDTTGLSFNDPGNGFEADTSDCGDTLPAGESCLVTVTFTPAAPGPGGSMLTVGSDQGATKSLNLTGDGRRQPPNPIFEDHFEQGGKP